MLAGLLILISPVVLIINVFTCLFFWQKGPFGPDENASGSLPVPHNAPASEVSLAKAALRSLSKKAQDRSAVLHGVAPLDILGVEPDASAEEPKKLPELEDDRDWPV